MLLYFALSCYCLLTLIFCQALKQKEKEETQLLSELQRTQNIVLTCLAELGAGSQLLPALTALTAAQSSGNGTTSVEAQGVGGGAEQTQNSKTSNETGEDEDNTVIDVMHDSEDDTSSTTSGSDGSCTTTSHKNNASYEYH